MGPKIRACPPHASGRFRHMGHDPRLQDAAEMLVRNVADHGARKILRVFRTIGGGVHRAAWDIVFVQNLGEEVGFITARSRPDQDRKSKPQNSSSQFATRMPSSACKKKENRN